jgi:hypothetical protein
MRRTALQIAGCLLFLLFTASPAHAQIWRLIWELSGPGPFHGPEFEWRLACLNAPDGSASPGAAAGTEEGGASGVLRILGPGCLINPPGPGARRRASFNVAVGVLDARRNNLQYASNATSRDVKLTTAEGTFWWRPVRSVEVGFGAGLMSFSGGGFNTFERFFFEPYRIDVRPLAIAAGPQHADWTEFLSVRAGAIIVPNSFSAADFGAIPGTFRTSREVLPTFSIFIDVEPIARSMRRR